MNGYRTAPLTFPEVFGLPLAVDLRTAARAFGICRGTAYRLIARDAFPCPVLRLGWRYRVPTTGLLSALGIEQSPVRSVDLQTGAAQSAQWTYEPFPPALLESEDFA
ncbi:DNA-binding protein [Kitasatospora sp. NPDC088264]|uniref:helix-turn-helix transcriptional regulator n=1 Tax=Kitasatospora sp. NPDC088264 TaxID=3155296 RepID=UPI0034278E7D